ncbi:MAG: hypothetical protein H0V90_11685 [Blastocatellia bacterium]|nr:hypothetical protein [Blastocatellia bacterium]
MPKRIGLIQTRGIGDIIIALPTPIFMRSKGLRFVGPLTGVLLKCSGG